VFLVIPQVFIVLPALTPLGLSFDALAQELLQAHPNLLEHVLDAFQIS